MSFIHEPRRPTLAIDNLRTRVAENAEFASLVFDLREVLDIHCASPSQMRAALKLVLHDVTWRVYRRVLFGLPTCDEEISLTDLFDEEPEDGSEANETGLSES